MPVVKSNILNNNYKEYFTEDVQGKDGITRPITKVVYVKQCPQCGGKMQVMSFGSTKSKGGSKIEYVRWKCPDKNCKHQETEY